MPKRIRCVFCLTSSPDMRKFRFQTLPQLRFHTLPAMLNRIQQTAPVAELISKDKQSYLMTFTDRRGENQRICALCVQEAWAADMDAKVNWDRRKMSLWRSEVSSTGGAQP